MRHVGLLVYNVVALATTGVFYSLGMVAVAIKERMKGHARK